jgi:hypothetical protein
MPFSRAATRCFRLPKECGKCNTPINSGRFGMSYYLSSRGVSSGANIIPSTRADRLDAISSDPSVADQCERYQRGSMSCATPLAVQWKLRKLGKPG